MEVDVGKVRLRLDDLGRVRYLSAPDISPDGEVAAYVVGVSDEGSGDLIPHVYEVSCSSGESTAVAQFNGSVEDMPKYSPLGDYLAFLSDRSGEKQIWLMRRTDGALRKLTSMRHGVEWFEWSPDGKSIAFEAPLWPCESPFEEMSAEEKAIWLHKRDISPVVIEDLMYKFDETYGVVDGSYMQIGVADVASGECRMITSGGVKYAKPSWSEDSTLLAFWGFPLKDAKAQRGQLFYSNVAVGEAVSVPGELRMANSSIPPLFDPAGTKLVYMSYKEVDGAYLPMPFSIPLEGGEPECIFPQDGPGHGIESAAIGRTAAGVVNPFLQRGADGYYFSAVWQGEVQVYRMGFDGGVEQLTEGKHAVHSFCVPKAGKLLYTRGNVLSLAELYVLDLDSGVEKQLTYANNWLGGIELSEPEDLTVRSADDTVNVHGWVVPPVGKEEGKKYPAVLYIHGGPECSYTYDFWFEVQHLAAKGFAVAYCDPRGSAGWGPEHMPRDAAWGSMSYDDIMTFMDGAIGLGYIDSELCGVTGGSYGGHMTNRIISTTQRFKAAVTQRSLCNLATSYGTGDIGFVQGDPSFKSMLSMLTDRAKSRSSTVRFIDNVKTPLLILHATADYRCSFEQGEQMFIAMKQRNPDVPVRFVVFPGENHGLTRTGKLHFQKAHLKELTDWFIQYLNGEENGNEA